MNKQQRIIQRLYEINKLEFEDSAEYLQIVCAVMNFNNVSWVPLDDLKDALLEQLTEEHSGRLSRTSAIQYAEMVSDICDDSDEWACWAKYEFSEEAFSDITNALSISFEIFTNLCESLMDFSKC